MDKIPMTPGGHKALSEEYRRRTSEDRPKIIADISEARAHGDLSENAEYHAAKEQQSLNEGRIKELETLLALADIVDISKLGGQTVQFGATVKIVDDDTELYAITSGGGVIRTAARQVRKAGRQTKGVRLMNLGEGDTLIAVARNAEEAEGGDETDTEVVDTATETETDET